MHRVRSPGGARGWARSAWAVLLCLLVPLLVGAGAAHAAEDFLDPKQAFQLHAERLQDGDVALHWQIANGYLLYRQRLHIRVDGAEIEVPLQAGEQKADPATGESMEVYHLALSTRIPAGAGGRLAEIEYQGCADAGLCYLPQRRNLRLDVAATGPLELLDELPQVPAAAMAVVEGVRLRPAVARDDSAGAWGRAGRVLYGGNLLEVAGTFLIFGVLLSLTPCVLPMVPILSSILVGQQVTTHRRGLQLAGAYALGMATVYTALGIAAGLAGEGLAAYLQQPWVLVGFALLLAGLALSMFDVYMLQVPAALQTRIATLCDRIGGGATGGAAAMGALSAVMVGPCVAAPLAGALLYIGRSHDVLLGGLALFALACGMSVPLLVAGASAGSLLPRAGAWMNRVKHVFGVLLLAVAWWMVAPLVGDSVRLAGWGLLALAGALFLGLQDPLPATAGPGTRALRAAVIALAVMGVFELSGAVLGAQDPLAPLAPIASSSRASAQVANATPHFQTIASAQELDRILIGAAGRPVLVDFYADWCVSCKEMERDTFTDPGVQQTLGNMALVRVDVTANTGPQRALLERFGLFGPPGLVLFDAKGIELSAARLIGLAQPRELLAHLQRFVGP